MSLSKNKVFSYELTVRGNELDSFGHVNNAVYLNYLEQARWDILRQKKLLEQWEAKGFLLAVIDLHIRYMKELKLFDTIVVETSMDKMEPYLVFHQKIKHKETGRTMAKSEVKTLLLDAERTPHDIPSHLIE